MNTVMCERCNTAKADEVRLISGSDTYLCRGCADLHDFEDLIDEADGRDPCDFEFCR